MILFKLQRVFTNLLFPVPRHPQKTLSSQIRSAIHPFLVSTANLHRHSVRVHAPQVTVPTHPTHHLSVHDGSVTVLYTVGIKNSTLPTLPPFASSWKRTVSYPGDRERAMSSSAVRWVPKPRREEPTATSSASETSNPTPDAVGPVQESRIAVGSDCERQRDESGDPPAMGATDDLKYLEAAIGRLDELRISGEEPELSEEQIRVNDQMQEDEVISLDFSSCPSYRIRDLLVGLSS